MSDIFIPTTVNGIERLHQDEREAIQKIVDWFLDRKSKGQLILHKVAGRGWVETEMRKFEGRKKIEC